MDLKILVNYDIVSSYAYGSFSIVLSLPIIVSILHFFQAMAILKYGNGRLFL